MIVPFTAGTCMDLLARTIGQKLSERLKVPVVVENRAGASGNIGTEAVAKSPADGYTLLMTASTIVQNAALSRSVPYDPVQLYADRPKRRPATWRWW
jgi:tripartite-type tricarboxylate transporter receptor subunit TctC